MLIRQSSYISKLSKNELKKNSILNSMEKCLFSIDPRRTFVLDSLKNSSVQVLNSNNLDERPPFICTDSFNCPFYKEAKNIDLIELLKKTNSQRVSKNLAQKSQKSTLKNANELFNYEKFLNKKITDKKNDGSYRYFKKVIRHAETFPKVQQLENNHELKEITIWCSNDYLGLGRHPYVQSKVVEAVIKYGAG
ncbi:unnamed protein product, partial [Brachionus calyciflorus]